MECQTRVTKLLGIRYPIIEGAMGIIGTTDLALAISEAECKVLGFTTKLAIKPSEEIISKQ
ncbi:hypothetical protein ACFLVV_03045 [Chloroflexota bacterium]|jgi:NAD(P)H-dependent flavin oxidoreductase YrpB (nitropropane dioxygenase family)